MTTFIRVMKMLVARRTVVAAACLPELGPWELLEGRTKRLRDNRTLASLQGQRCNVGGHTPVTRDVHLSGLCASCFQPIEANGWDLLACAAQP